VAKDLPSEIDLRAAYCIPIVQHIVSLLNGLDREFGPSPPSPAEAELRADLRRLQLYLLPRLPHLELLGVVTAQMRAKEDLASLDAFAETCRAKCRHLQDTPSGRKPSRSSCFEKCQGTHPANTRIKACSDFDWLPY
jgi:hypothetical protein